MIPAGMREYEISAAVRDVLAERRRQVEVEGFDAEHDDKYMNELPKAAVCFAWPHFPHDTRAPDPYDAGHWVPSIWPWAARWWKPKGRRDSMVKATALLLAEIERIDRLDAKLAAHRALANPIPTGDTP